MTTKEYEIIYNRFVENIRSNYEKFYNPFDDVNFLLDTLEEIKLLNGYVLDAYKVMDTYYREGEYFMQLYTCIKNSPYEYVPRLTNIRDTFLKKLHLQKCHKEYLPVYNSKMYISRPMPIALVESIPCADFAVPFNEKAIWEALMPRIAYMHLPKFGHGAYQSSKLVFEKTDLGNALSNDIIDKIENGVFIQGDTATIKYTYWNEWQGLVKVTHKAYRIFEGTISWDIHKEKEVIMSTRSNRRF